MELKYIEINKIKPNPFQPREKFDKEKLQELADNISKHGMIEPIVVTPKDGNYMIVAGERRWRANQLSKQNKVYAVVKKYNSDTDIKRDSLVENEMRQNLSNEEFKAFTYSLAESLGERDGITYYKKGWINVPKLSEYVTGIPLTHDTATPFYKRLNRIFIVDKKATTKVKNLLKNEKIDLQTAANIASIKDKQIQKDLAEDAKHKSTAEIREEVKRHNFEQQAKEVRQKIEKESDEDKKRQSEIAIVSRFCNKLNSWNDSINYLSEHIKNNRNILSKFSHKSKMEMLDTFKPLKRDLDKALHLTSKIMEALSK